MAIKGRSLITCTGRGNCEMTTEEFKLWLRTFDADRDGRISRAELEEAVRYAGGWFARRKSLSGMRSADADGNGYIDANEINSLKDFARKNLGIRLVNFY